MRRLPRPGPPRLLFVDPGAPAPHPNHLRFRLGKGNEGISLTLQAKARETLASQPVDLGFGYQEALGGERMEDHERLLDDAILGDPARFAGEDGVEEASNWAIVSRRLSSRMSSYSDDGTLSASRSCAACIRRRGRGTLPIGSVGIDIPSPPEIFSLHLR